MEARSREGQPEASHGAAREQGESQRGSVGRRAPALANQNGLPDHQGSMRQAVRKTSHHIIPLGGRAVLRRGSPRGLREEGRKRDGERGTGVRLLIRM